ncbi:MAG TPA: trypsin-like peptidase domain-containing protein [Acidimicrobiales bacterium]|jgi:serine protease Do
MSLLDELTGVTGRVLAASGGAVVRIGRAEGRGAGIVVGAGTVLTSAHNLRGEETTVTFADGRSVTGTVKGVDADGDLAVLAADTGAATPVAWADADADTTPAGAVVFALALPVGGGVRITNGAVSSAGRSFRGPRGRLITDGIEHTAPLGRGSSGGPLLDTEGRLIGVNTHRPGDGLYLALSATAALRSRVDALARGETPTRRRLGVALAPPHVARRLRAAVGLEPRDGVLVRDVAEDSPAAGAGLQRGDLVVAAGGRPVGSIDHLLSAVDGVGEDGTLSLTVWRGAGELEVTVRFAAAQ